jgi:hypothetical protein
MPASPTAEYRPSAALPQVPAEHLLIRGPDGPTAFSGPAVFAEFHEVLTPCGVKAVVATSSTPGMYFPVGQWPARPLSLRGAQRRGDPF